MTKPAEAGFLAKFYEFTSRNFSMALSLAIHNLTATWSETLSSLFESCTILGLE